MIPSVYYKYIRRSPSSIAYWRLNDAAESTRALDWANKYTLNGIYDKNPSRSISLIHSDLSAASRIFEKTEQNIEIPDAIPLRLTESLSIEMWICPTEPGQTAALLGKMNSAFTHPEPYYVGLKSGKLYFSLGNGTTEKGIETSKEISTGTPSYICVLLFKENPIEILSIIINEEISKIENLGSQEIKDGGKSIFIAALGNNTNRFKGNISEIAIYNESISASRAIEHFKLGRQILPEPARITTYDPPSYS